MKANWIYTKVVRVKHRFLVSLFLIIAVMMAAVPVFAEGPVEDDSNIPNGPPVIQIPIIFDGVLYQPDQFNPMISEMHSKGALALFCITPNEFLGFSSYEGYVIYAEKNNLPILKMPETLGTPKYILDVDPDCVENYRDINYGGQIFYAYNDAEYPNLHSYGWGDSISSLKAGSDAGEILFEDINFGGLKCYVYPEVEVSNLHDFGWGDRASSIAGATY